VCERERERVCVCVCVSLCVSLEVTQSAAKASGDRFTSPSRLQLPAAAAAGIESRRRLLGLKEGGTAISPVLPRRLANHTRKRSINTAPVFEATLPPSISPDETADWPLIYRPILKSVRRELSLSNFLFCSLTLSLCLSLSLSLSHTHTHTRGESHPAVPGL